MYCRIDCMTDSVVTVTVDSRQWTEVNPIVENFLLSSHEGFISFLPGAVIYEGWEGLVKAYEKHLVLSKTCCVYDKHEAHKELYEVFNADFLIITSLLC